MENLLEQVNRIYQRSLITNQSVLNYFYGRGVTLETLREFEVGFSSSYCLNDLKTNHESELKALGLLNEKGNERNWRRVMFPIRDASGKIVGYNGRSLKPNDDIKYLLSPESMGFDKSATLYNLHQAKDVISEKDHVFLVEGVFDVMAMHQMGIRNVACSLGTSLSKEQVNLLKNYTRNVVFAYDGDFAGFEASVKNSRTLSQTLSVDEDYKFNDQTRYLAMPEGMDPGDLLKSPKLLKPILHNAKSHLGYFKSSCEANPHYAQVFEKIRNGDRINKEIQKIPKAENTKLLEKLDIVEVVGGYVDLRKSGRDYKGLCPFHGEKTASLVVSPKKQIFKCFGCGEGGNVVKFVAQIEKISYKEAMLKLSQNMRGFENEPKRKKSVSKDKAAEKEIEV